MTVRSIANRGSFLTRLTLIVATVTLGAGCAASRAAVADVPTRLTDPQFWQLVVDFSEPGGYFRSANITNLTSNELLFQWVIPDLVTRTKPGGVYLGVGPEQNFTYMAALKPSMAFIFDIRRGNLDMQLLYKAAFELSANRADFISLLFSLERPAGLGAASTAEELFRAFARVAPSATLYARTLARIEAQLTEVHRFPLPEEDRASIRELFRLFFQSGFYLRASPSYADLMTTADQAGVNRSYLATEDNYARLKDLESRNLVVPIVGDFGGPKAIRAVGRYLTSLNANVAAFYLSNVEQYLGAQWTTFCANVASLPLDSTSTFIRSQSGGGGGFGGGNFVSSLGRMLEETRSCAATR